MHHFLASGTSFQPGPQTAHASSLAPLSSYGTGMAHGIAAATAAAASAMTNSASMPLMPHLFPAGSYAASSGHPGGAALASVAGAFVQRAAMAAAAPGGGTMYPVLPPIDKSTPETSMLYASYRLFGNPMSTRIAQSQGDVPPVMVLNPTTGTVGTQFMNPEALRAAVDGRFMTCLTGTDTYRDDGAAGFVPAAMMGMSASLPRPEQYVQTVSTYADPLRGTEYPVTRPVYATQTYDTMNMNLRPQSEADQKRTENAARLNRMMDVYRQNQMAAAGML